MTLKRPPRCATGRCRPGGPPPCLYRFPGAARNCRGWRRTAGVQGGLQHSACRVVCCTPRSVPSSPSRFQIPCLLPPTCHALCSLRKRAEEDCGAQPGAGSAGEPQRHFRQQWQQEEEADKAPPTLDVCSRWAMLMAPAGHLHARSMSIGNCCTVCHPSPPDTQCPEDMRAPCSWHEG